MSYKTNADLPSLIRMKFSNHEQTVFRKAFNSAYKKSKDNDRKITIGPISCDSTSSIPKVIPFTISWSAIEEITKEVAIQNTKRAKKK